MDQLASSQQNTVPLLEEIQSLIRTMGSLGNMVSFALVVHLPQMCPALLATPGKCHAIGI